MLETLKLALLKEAGHVVTPAPPVPPAGELLKAGLHAAKAAVNAKVEPGELAEALRSERAAVKGDRLARVVAAPRPQC